MKEHGLTKYLLIAIWGGLAFLLLMPFLIGIDTIFPYIVRKSIFARALIEILAGLWLILILHDGRYRPKPSWVIYALCAYLLLSVVSAVFGVSFNRSMWSTYERMMGIWDLLHWVVLALILASVMRTSRAWFWLFNWNLFLVLLLCLIGFTEMYGIGKKAIPEALNDFLYPELIYRGCGGRICATLGNPSFLAAILVVNIPIAAGLFVRSFYQSKEPPATGKKPKVAPRNWPLLLSRAFWALCTLTFLWILYQNGTRGAFIGLAAAALFLGALALFRVNKVARKPLLIVAAVVFGGLSLLYFWDVSVNIPAPKGLVTSTAGERITVNIVQDGSVKGRLIAARAALHGFAQRPVLGWGPDNFAAAFDKNVRAEDFYLGENYVDNAHNKIINDLVTVGLLGTLAYLAVWIAPLWFVVRRRRRPDHEIFTYVVLCALAAYFVQNLLLFDTPAMILQWTLLVGFVAAQERGFEDEAQEEPKAQPANAAQAPAPRKQSAAAIPVLDGWAFGAAAVLVIGLFAFAVYFFNYRTYQAGKQFELMLESAGEYSVAIDAAQRARPEDRPPIQAAANRLFDAQITAFEKTTNLAPTLGNEPRRVFFSSIVNQLRTLTPEQTTTALKAFSNEWPRGIDIEPKNFQYLRSVVFVFQSFKGTPETSQGVEVLLARLERVGSERFEVPFHKAVLDLDQGRYQQGIATIEAYLDIVPEIQKSLIPVEEQLCKTFYDADRNGFFQTPVCFKFIITPEVIERLKQEDVSQPQIFKRLIAHAYYTEDYKRVVAISDAFTSRGGVLDNDMRELTDRARSLIPAS
ncbi:MAG: O-antigen ligase family protein [Chloroflexi bacterium]|nr:O-antigen ligase family protein [Chloroflexota bacterium]